MICASGFDRSDMKYAVLATTRKGPPATEFNERSLVTLSALLYVTTQH